MARSFTKNALRKKDLEELANDRQTDYQNFWTNLIEPTNQERLGEYLQGLKKK